MKHSSILWAVVLLSACVSAPPALGPMPPVGVVFTTSPLVSQYVQTDNLTLATNVALRQYATGAGPASIAVHFTDLAAMPNRKDVLWYPDTLTARSIPRPIISPTPFNEGVRDMPEVHIIPANVYRPGVKGTYVIKDASGKVLESQPIYLSLEYSTGNPDRMLIEQRFVAEYLARRAAALTHKQNG